MMKRMPVIFSGHGSPMIALQDDELTRGMRQIGEKVLQQYGKPKAILAISAHWYTKGTFVQTAEEPEQIYDMYGFPKELYEVKYPVKGCQELSERSGVAVDNSWGVDHGSWTVLVHMFPKADIPVVQLSANATIPAEKIIELGKKLSVLRNEGYLIFGSGNIVHNLRLVEWDNPNGTDKALKFNQYIIDSLTKGAYENVLHYETGPEAKYAVPTPEHYLPIIYCLGAADGDRVEVFNNVCNLGSMAMTGFIFS